MNLSIDSGSLKNSIGLIIFRLICITTSPSDETEIVFDSHNDLPIRAITYRTQFKFMVDIEQCCSCCSKLQCDNKYVNNVNRILRWHKLLTVISNKNQNNRFHDAKFRARFNLTKDQQFFIHYIGSAIELFFLN